MKKLLLLLVFLFPIKVIAISADAYIVMDADSNRVLESKNMNKEKLIASTTKIMTAIVVIENAKLDTKVVVDERVLKAYGSAIYIEIGEELTIRDLLYGLMLRSGNDAAIVLKNYFEDNKKDLVKLMNDKAKKLNMNKTIFYNPHGLEEDDGTYNTSTAYDMALLMSYAIKNKEFVKISGTKKYNIKTNIKSYSWINKNKLLNNYDRCIAGKTGFTKKARRTLVTASSYNNSNLVVVTLNDGNDFNDHKDLYEKIFKNYTSVKLLDKNNFEIRNEGYYKGVNFYIKNNYKVMLDSKEKNTVTLNYIIEKNDDYKNNQKIGKVQVLINNDKIYEEDIYIVKKNYKKDNKLIKKIKNIFK